MLVQGRLAWVTSDEEMKNMLKKDGLRWTGGVKVSGPNSKMYCSIRSENNQQYFKIHPQCNVLKLETNFDLRLLIIPTFLLQVRLLLAFLDCLEDNLSLLREMETPFLALHGANDWLCNPKGSRSGQENICIT